MFYEVFTGITILQFWVFIIQKWLFSFFSPDPSAKEWQHINYAQMKNIEQHSAVWRMHGSPSKGIHVFSEQLYGA